MSTDESDAKTTLLMVVLALWFAVFGYSVFHLLAAEDIAAATLPGLSRTVVFFGWQGVAGMIAFACWGIGRSYPKGSGIRRVSALPLGMALALVLVVAGMAVFGG